MVMKALLITIMVSSLAACASGAPAPQEGPLKASAAPAPVPAESTTESGLQPGDPGYWDEIVCRRAPVTGTRLSRARCHSRYDWARMAGAATETMRDINSKPIPCLDGPGCEP
jgi:hypothetical protein